MSQNLHRATEQWDGKPLDEKPLFYQVVEEFREGVLLTTTQLEVVVVWWVVLRWRLLVVCFGFGGVCWCRCFCGGCFGVCWCVLALVVRPLFVFSFVRVEKEKRREGAKDRSGTPTTRRSSSAWMPSAFNGNGVLLLQLIKTYTRIALTAHSARFSARDM